MTRRIGIYSGTFDPIHRGHLAFATEALKVCSLDEVVFLPEQEPRQKRQVTEIARRMALIKSAIAPISNLRVEQLASKQFTIEHTLPELHQLFTDSHLTFLVGSDVARTFLFRWKKLDTLLTLPGVSFAIGMRANDSANDITKIMNELEREYNVPLTYTLVSAPDSDASSSQIRKMQNVY